MRIPSQVQFKKLVVGPLAVNCYILFDAPSGSAVLVDPGGDAPLILEALADLGVALHAVYLTHGHVDHAAAAAEISDRLAVPVYVHPGDLDLVQLLPMQAQMFGLEKPPVPSNLQTLSDGAEIAVGQAKLRVRHTPGHSPGSICFLDENGRHAWVGDLVFQGSVGRTDLPGGSSEQLFRSIRQVILTLEDDWQLHPGHGPDTTVGQEKRANPFLVELT